MKLRNIKHKSKQKGFTLIELLLVVLIIGILSGVMVSVIDVRGLRKKSRDAQRVSDLKQIQTALELYFSDNRIYPTSANWQNVSTALSGLSGSYISALPTDPSNGTTSVDITGAGVSCFGVNTYRYMYRTDGAGGRYIIGSIVEVPTSAQDSRCSNLSNCTAGYISNCNCASTYCYGVQNPL